MRTDSHCYRKNRHSNWDSSNQKNKKVINPGPILPILIRELTFNSITIPTTNKYRNSRLQSKPKKITSIIKILKTRTPGM
ncbi:hypothetical protein Hanom_Chr16g01513481 [Helianthus anomalus]